MKTTFTDRATTIIGILIIAWTIALYTYSLINLQVKFELSHCAGFLAFSVYLILFKGDSAKSLFQKTVDKFIPKKNESTGN